MTGAEYIAILARLGLSDARAARFLGVNRATVWRWRASGPPLAVAKLLRVMAERRRRLTPGRVDALLETPLRR